MRPTALSKAPALLILTIASIVPSVPADSSRKVSPDDVAARVRQARAGQGMAWTSIPWTASLLEARKAAQAENCPVFLFTLDGNIGTGRC
jgi:hypothetical protein